MENVSSDLFTIECMRDYNDLVEFRDDMRISKKIFSKLYRSKKIMVNNEFRRKSLALKKGDRVSLLMDEEETSSIASEKMDLDIVYEDMDILVLNKEASMPVHTTKYHQRGTLSNGILYYFKDQGIKKKVRIVNRLDEGTSGLILVAKSQHVDNQLSIQFRERTVGKKYKALVEGRPNEEGLIERRICSDRGTKKYLGKDGKEALTYYRLLESYGNISLMELNIPTGRSHQIRLHLSSIGHPVVGDSLYGSRIKARRTMLHSYYLSIKHPRSQEVLEFTADMPKDMTYFVEKIL